PWTNLKLNTDPDQFQFAVVSDRTGGHREKVFSKAVYQINLLQPTFVMSVGDLIEGYTQKDAKLAEEWDQFDGFVTKFEMPFVFVHKPIWTARDLEKNGWGEVERALAGRKYTVYCGHVHRYRKYVRNGMSYYQLATTGGGSRMRGVEYGEFDHVSWVTMKKDA